jgi:hypothetical protein
MLTERSFDRRGDGLRMTVTLVLNARGRRPPLDAQIPPVWIERLNQGDLLDAQPALDLLLSRDGQTNVTERLKIDEFLDVVARGKSGHVPFAMLRDWLKSTTCCVRNTGFCGAPV